MCLWLNLKAVTKSEYTVWKHLGLFKFGWASSKNVSGALCQLISWLISDMCVIFFQGHNADDIAETVIMNGR